MMGVPLIAYTIEAANESGIFDRIVVSTDSPEIADVVREYGVEIPFLRDPTLADDFTPVSAVTLDMLMQLDPLGNIFSHVCQLMPNCPLRSASDIIESYRQFIATRAESQISVVRYGWQNPWWAMRRDEKYTLEPVFKEYITERSQDLPELFCPTGAIWWAESRVLRREGTFHIGNRTGWEMPWDRGVDIDTDDDWAIAEILLGLSRSGRESKIR